MLPVSLDCPILIAPSIFSNVYFFIFTRFVILQNVQVNLDLNYFKFKFKLKTLLESIYNMHTAQALMSF